MVSKRDQERAETPFITCLLLTFSLLIPIVSVFLVSIATVDNKDKLHLHWDPMISKAKSIMVESFHSKRPKSHFIVDKGLGARNLCVNGAREYENTPAFPHLIIEESHITLLNADRRIRNRLDWQLCIAHHDHQHAFRLKTYPKYATIHSMLDSKIDCDLYVSANASFPTSDGWNWRSENFGEDSITIYSQSEELKESKLDTLFISMKEKSNEFNKPNNNRCILEVEILSIKESKTVYEGSLRGVVE